MRTGTIPRGWKRTNLGAVVNKITAKAAPSEYSNAKFIGMDCIQPHTLRPAFLYDFKDFKSAGNLFEENQVLYGRMRPYLNKVYKAQFNGVCSGEFIVLDCEENLSPDLLQYILHSRAFVRFVNEKTSGDRPRVTFEEIGEYHILLPPIDEQERIVAKIEELFSELDVGIEGLKRARAQLKTYRRSVLKHAFEGRLTNDNVKDGELPTGWRWVTSGDLFDFVTSGARGWARHYSESGAVFLRITNLDFETLALDMSPNKVQRVVVPETVEAERIKVKAGDFLFSITGYLGMFAIVPVMEPAYINQHISLARPKKGLNRKFVGYWVIAESGGIHHLNRARKGAVKAGLGLDDIKNFPVPICSPEEQQLVVAEIERRLSVCDKMEESIESSLQQVHALRQSVLNEAFEGRLN